MKRRNPVVPTTLAVVTGLLVAACMERAVAPNAAPDARALLLAHSPAHHGASAAPALTSTPAYASLDGAAAEGTDGGALDLTVDAAGAIPRFPDAFLGAVAVFGYAWADLDTGAGIVSVIHPVIGRDSRQNPDGWHTHPVQLTGGTKPAGASDFCVVSIGTSQGGIAIRDDVMRVQMADGWAAVSADALDVAASFIVQGDDGCAATGLGVVILASRPL